MLNDKTSRTGPLVTVLMSSYGRPAYVKEAIQSVLSQTYENFEFIIVRDGGCEIGQIVNGFGDGRIVFIDRSRNRGKPYCLNEALKRARGKYVAYIDNDDKYYPHHLQVLVDALESTDKCQVAYSDLYKSHCEVRADGRRVVLSKNVETSRDFDRMAMLMFNHVLHVSVMHHRSLLEKTGPYDEKLNVMIDWDMTRRLAFFSDFKHVPIVTGEYYGPVGDCDRISIVRRKNKWSYIWNLLSIRTSRPPKPWPKMGDMSLILLADGLSESLDQMLRDIWSHTIYPYQIYLPLERAELLELKTMVPNVIGVPVKSGCGDTEKIDAALKHCQGEFVAVVPNGFEIVGPTGKESDDVGWIEKSIYPLINGSDANEAFELVRSRPGCWACVFGIEQLRRARQLYRHLDIESCAKAAGIKVRQPAMEEWPFQFDNMLGGASELEKQGDWSTAAGVFEHIYKHWGNEIWMKTRQANALYHAGKYEESCRLAGQLNDIRPTVSALLIEARAHRKQKQLVRAIELYERAREILDGNEDEHLTTPRDSVGAAGELVWK